ncbi:MAG: helicase-related protein [Xenococcaceae cyanobacterium MO_207.B15]|nr:helicase-related protein [Xenococcaceae cyanobacterium MO_207.B15]
MNNSNLGQDLGHLFEVGFNIGMLTYLGQKKIKCNYSDRYQQDLQQVSFRKIVRKLIDNENIISQQHREIVDKWATFFLQKSFLAGLNFLEEYFTAIEWNSERKLKRLQVVYFQSYLADDNSLGTYLKGEQKVYQDWFEQFNELGLDVSNIDTFKYSKTGEFLKADSLVYFRYKDQVRILVLDYSIYAIKSIRNLEDLNSVEVLRQILLSNISYLKSKSVFANLGLDSKTNQFLFSESLSRYYKAFVCKDKETIKAIQAGSYAYSFWSWLKSQQQILPEDEVTFNIIGYSDRDFASLCLTQDNIQLLETCYHIYQQKNPESEISYARAQVLQIIKRKAQRSFTNGKKFINELLEVSSDGIHLVTHQETLKDFNNYLDTIPLTVANNLGISPSLNLQEAHGQLIQQALSLNNDNLYVFATGNPGIGKTTAISDYLKQKQILEEGFLFLYISPRTQVNLDIVEKFKNNPDSDYLCDDRLITINTNFILIEKNNGDLTVQYYSNKKSDRFTLQAVDFIPQSEKIAGTSNTSKSVTRKTAKRLQDSKNNKKGVLHSISEAIYSLLNDGHNNIVATVALQSLKKLSDGGDTLHHFKRIFRDVYNEREGKPIEAKLKQLSQRVKHIFIAIDEITGDRSGVEFLSGISLQLKRYELTNRDYFNTKIIVADASIIDSDVIQQHLSETTAEPNKIFFRKATKDNSCLTKESFNFKQQPAIAINTNSYPAKNLHITYKTFIHSLKFQHTSKNLHSTKKYNLEKRVQSAIIKDIESITAESPEEQIIVYIQDKKRLSDLINFIRETREKFEPEQDYLEIHADLSESEKQKIPKYQNKVQIIFMTASASRGLSFPRAKHILVDLPRFEIEANLMEVIQVIYRGRGNQNIDIEDKQLIFYLTEQAVYYIENAEDRKFSLQESKLNILNFLIILHISIKTRIYGYGNIANEKYMMIPVGGKSVFTAGESLSNKIKTLIIRLKKEHQKRRHDLRLQKAYKQLEDLMKTAEITLWDTTDKTISKKISYLDLLKNIRQEFIKRINGSLDALLNFPSIQIGYVAGNLLLVSLADKRVEEIYQLKIDDKTVTLREILSQLKQDDRLSENIQFLIDKTLELIEELEQQKYRNQRLEQESNYLDQYYAVPLFIFLVEDVFSVYFANKEIEPEDQRFRDILENYVYSMFPIGQVIPIGYKYEKIPFLIFRSYSLKEMRDKRFSDKYLMNSKELNILNLILAQSETN